MRFHFQTKVFVVLFCALVTTTVFASDTPFSSNVDAINKAAQSVLMLEIYDANDELIGTGSGFIAFDNFTLVTNEHVIKDAAIIIGNSDDGNQYMITKLISADEKKDIAILEFFSPTNLSPLALNDQGKVRRAEAVVAIGSPLGQKNSVSLGNISALLKEDEVSLIQFTAPISPGSSGGALFNDKGRVIGITSGFFTEGQNINLAINIDEVINLYFISRASERVQLMDYSRNKPSPTEIVTSHPTDKLPQDPTEPPKSTPEQLEGFVPFSPSGNFDASVLEPFEGYKYDKFDKNWDYVCSIALDGNHTLYMFISGTSELDYPPNIMISDSSQTKSSAFIKSIDILIEDTIYTYNNLRFVNGLEGSVFFYLGTVGEKMVTDMTKVTSMSLRLSMQDSEQVIFNVNLHEYTPIFFWCESIIRYKIFNLFEPTQLTYADELHDATVR